MVYCIEVSQEPKRSFFACTFVAAKCPNNLIVQIGENSRKRLLFCCFCVKILKAMIA